MPYIRDSTDRNMFAEYIKAALERVEYEIMEDDEPKPYYAHVHELPGIWATGKTFEDCRNEPISVTLGCRFDIFQAIDFS